MSSVILTMLYLTLDGRVLWHQNRRNRTNTSEVPSLDFEPKAEEHGHVQEGSMQM